MYIYIYIYYIILYIYICIYDIYVYMIYMYICIYIQIYSDYCILGAKIARVGTFLALSSGEYPGFYVSLCFI